MTVIGLLAAIAVPTYQNQRRHAYRVALQAELRNSVLEIETWALERPTGYTGLDSSQP